MSSRRSSNESIIRSGSRQSSTSTAVVKFKVPQQVSEVLEHVLDWDFEIFRLEEMTEKHPLIFVGTELFRRFDVFNTLNIDEGTCRAWLSVIESNYHCSNTYHNSTHAADVMQVKIPQKFYQYHTHFNNMHEIIHNRRQHVIFNNSQTET